MNPPKLFTVENLIADGETIHIGLSPKRLTKQINSALAKLSILSSRAEYWDCFVCAIGFSGEHSVPVNDLLIQVAQNYDKETAQGQTREFLDYCSTLTSIPEKSLAAAAQIIVSAGVIVDPKMLMDFETCYEMCGDNKECLTDCFNDPKPKPGKRMI